MSNIVHSSIDAVTIIRVSKQKDNDYKMIVVDEVIK